MRILRYIKANSNCELLNLEWRIDTIIIKPIIIKKENILKTKSFHFAIRIINLYKFLKKKQGEYILIKQVLRSGTSIGALIRESENAESTRDFVHKLTIALKEADELSIGLNCFLLQDL